MVGYEVQVSRQNLNNAYALKLSFSTLSQAQTWIMKQNIQVQPQANLL
jgi:hypothetical protein